MERPYTNMRLNKRDLVWYHRKQAAWDLAHKLGEVTEESYGKAFELLNSCKNVALGFINCNEQENEYNWKRIDRKRDALIAREDRLNERLKPYGCKLDGYRVLDFDFERNVPLNDHSYLYFFD